MRFSISRSYIAAAAFFAALACSAALLPQPAYAQERATANEAVAMAKAAIAAIKSDKASAYAAINDKVSDKKFHDRDLYVAVYDMKGNSHAHGVNAAMVGKNFMGLKDPDGVMLAEEFIKVINEKGSGWVDYKWPHPVTSKLEAKTGYLEAVGDGTFVVVGVYK
jgi:signal transduction histidine kinase